MEVRDIAAALAKQFEGEPIEEEDGTFTVEVVLPDGDQIPVSVYGDRIDDQGNSVLMMRAAGGDSLDDADLMVLLEMASTTWFGRLYYESETESMVAEAALPMAGLDLADVQVAMVEVAELALGAQAEVGEFDEDEDEEDDEA